MYKKGSEKKPDIKNIMKLNAHKLSVKNDGLYVIHIKFDEESKNMMNECWIDFFFFLSTKLETARRVKISNHISLYFFDRFFSFFRNRLKNHYLTEFEWLSSLFSIYYFSARLDSEITKQFNLSAR